jgi:transposase
MSHTITFPILTETWQDHRIEKRFEAAKEVYNAVLGEYLRRYDMLRDSLAYQKADTWDERKSICRENGVGVDGPGLVFTKKESQNIRQDVIDNGCWIREHLSSNQCDSIAVIASEAMEDHVYRGKGRPQFKTASRKNELKSISMCNQIYLRDAEGGRTHKSGDDFTFDPSETPYTLVWSNGARGSSKEILELPLEEPGDRYIEALGHTSNYCEVSIVRKRIKSSEGEWRYFCHIASSIDAPPNPNIDPNHGERVGIDMGPSTVAVYNEKGDFFRADIVGPLEDKHEEIARLQRAVDRKRRANNSDKFEEDGTVKHHSKWEKRWCESNTQKELKERLTDVQRQLREHRKRLHEQLANKVLEYGTDIIVEDNSYKAWQMGMFGSSIKHSAPSAFIDILSYKASALDGSVTKVSTWDTKLSQRCLCGELHQKELSDRTHRCEKLGIEFDRDLFSAFLACFCDLGEGLDLYAARKHWKKYRSS